MLTTDNNFFLSGKLSYTFRSGELKTFHCMSCQISARYAKVTWMPCPWPQFKKKISVMNKYKITVVHWFLAYNSNHINRLWWAKKLFTVIWLFCYYLPLEKGVTLYFWTNLNSLPHEDALCEVLVVSGEENKRWKVYSTNDYDHGTDRQWTNFNGKANFRHWLWWAKKQLTVMRWMQIASLVETGLVLLE